MIQELFNHNTNLALIATDLVPGLYQDNQSAFCVTEHQGKNYLVQYGISDEELEEYKSENREVILFKDAYFSDIKIDYGNSDSVEVEELMVQSVNSERI